MSALAAPAQPVPGVRALAGEDLAAVVALDAALQGRSRRAYVERRLQAALREPALHAQFAAVDAHGLAGHLLARVLQGEFGRTRRALRIELVGVRADVARCGHGRRLFDALRAWALRHQVPELRTAALWTDHAMLGWLDALGFRLGDGQIVERALDAAAAPRADDELAPQVSLERARETNFGADADNDHEAQARERAAVRAMHARDLPAIVRIDGLLTGRARGAAIEAQLAETLADSAIRVSLVAERDGTLAGYLMARVDLGDFGRTEPVAVLDTLGVDPEHAHRHVGAALLAQLCAQLAALRVERVETLVGSADLALRGFLHDAGFAPSQRLAFVRALAH